MIDYDELDFDEAKELVESEEYTTDQLHEIFEKAGFELMKIAELLDYEEYVPFCGYKGRACGRCYGCAYPVNY